MRRIATVLFACVLGLLPTVLPTAVASAATPAPPSVSDRPLYRPSANRTSAAALAAVDAANAYVDRSYPATPAYWHTTFCSASANCPGRNPWYATTAQVQVEATTNAKGYFYAHQFGFNGTGAFGGYVGLQTQLVNCNPGCANVGRGMIFSVFGGTGATTGPLGGLVVHGTNEGDYWSIHVTVPWVTGHVYAYNASQPRQTSGDTWALQPIIVASIIDKTTAVTYPLGTINVPAGVNGFLPATYEWTEEYSGGYTDCSQVVRSAALYLGGATSLTPTYPPAATYPSGSFAHIDTSAGCTNSAVIDLGTAPQAKMNARLVVGALS